MPTSDIIILAFMLAIVVAFPTMLVAMAVIAGPLGRKPAPRPAAVRSAAPNAHQPA